MINGELIVDNFAGGGGASTGIELATGKSVDIAINHDRTAAVCIKRKRRKSAMRGVCVCKMHSQVLSFTKGNITENGLEVKKQVSTNILGSEV